MLKASKNKHNSGKVLQLMHHAHVDDEDLLRTFLKFFSLRICVSVDPLKNTVFT